VVCQWKIRRYGLWAKAKSVSRLLDRPLRQS
jgi:hypothetical protein